MVSVPGLFPGWLLQPPGCFPCLHSCLLTLSFSWNIQGNHHGCKSHHMFLCPKPSLTVHGIQTEIGVTVALVPVWSGPCHLPYLFFLPLPSLSESNSSGLISVSWIRPAKLCLGVPGVLSLASHLPPFLSPLGSRDLPQAFPDYVCEVTSILSTSIFFFPSYISSVSNLLHLFTYSFIFAFVLHRELRPSFSVICHLLFLRAWLVVSEYVLDEWESEHIVQWDMSSERIRTCCPMPALVICPIKYFVLTPFPLLFHIPSPQLLPGITSQIDHLCLEGKTCVCVCDLREPTVWGGRLTWKQIMTLSVMVCSELWEKQAPTCPV